MNDVENLRKRAKQVIRDHRSGLVTVAERLRRSLPPFAGMSDVEVLPLRSHCTMPGSWLPPNWALAVGTSSWLSRVRCLEPHRSWT